MTDDETFLWIEQRDRLQEARFRQFMIEEDKLDELAKYDATMKRIKTGEYGAGATWHSISDAQRRALRQIEAGTWKFRPKTMKCLMERDLAHWDGPTPKLTERGTFVLKVGSVQPRF